ncbi:helix-turn-helix transcriptional regulator [Actinomadura kijaniata]
MGNPPKTTESINFGREVRQRRKRAKISQQELADRLSVVRSYISQVETGAAQCREDFAQRMDSALNTGTEIHEAWKEFIEPLHEDDVIPQYFADFEKAEQKANEIRAYEAYRVHGLLQTQSYARVLLNDEDALARRIKRQEWLARNPAPLLCAVLDESILYRQIGTPEVMREQLQYLVEVSERENIKLQVAPVSWYRGVRGSFIIATLPNRQEVMYATHQFGGAMTHEPFHIERAARTMATLQAEALNVKDTRALIRKVIEERWT